MKIKKPKTMGITIKLINQTVFLIEYWTQYKLKSPAFLIVDSLCAIVNTVLPFETLWNASWINFSLSASNALNYSLNKWNNWYI